ncbi:MAG: TGS domain-containing protein [Candidatus Aenigmatarchaeota archaeon]
MPINATVEYFKAEGKYLSAKTNEEKIAALEEMIRTLPKHKGTENVLAQLKGKMSKLKKTGKKKISKKGIAKEGEAQICLIGLTQSGKSTMLAKITDAKPTIAGHAYTTTKPEIGMMDYSGVKLQLVEIPSTFSPEYMSIARSSDAIVLVIRRVQDRDILEDILSDNFIRTKRIFVNSSQNADEIKKRIWSLLGFMRVYAKKTKTAMALPIGSTVTDFCQRIHKDFIKNFRFARVWRGNRVIQAGLNYRLEDGDAVEIHVK